TIRVGNTIPKDTEILPSQRQKFTRPNARERQCENRHLPGGIDRLKGCARLLCRERTLLLLNDFWTVYLRPHRACPDEIVFDCDIENQFEEVVDVPAIFRGKFIRSEMRHEFLDERRSDFGQNAILKERIDP